MKKRNCISLQEIVQLQTHTLKDSINGQPPFGSKNMKDENFYWDSVRHQGTVRYPAPLSTFSTVRDPTK